MNTKLFTIGSQNFTEARLCFMSPPGPEARQTPPPGPETRPPAPTEASRPPEARAETRAATAGTAAAGASPEAANKALNETVQPQTKGEEARKNMDDASAKLKAAREAKGPDGKPDKTAQFAAMMEYVGAMINLLQVTLHGQANEKISPASGPGSSAEAAKLGPRNEVIAALKESPAAGESLDPKDRIKAIREKTKADQAESDKKFPNPEKTIQDATKEREKLVNEKKLSPNATKNDELIQKLDAVIKEANAAKAKKNATTEKLKVLDEIQKNYDLVERSIGDTLGALRGNKITDLDRMVLMQELLDMAINKATPEQMKAFATKVKAAKEEKKKEGEEKTKESGDKIETAKKAGLDAFKRIFGKDPEPHGDNEWKVPQESYGTADRYMRFTAVKGWEVSASYGSWGSPLKMENKLTTGNKKDETNKLFGALGDANFDLKNKDSAA